MGQLDAALIKCDQDTRLGTSVVIVSIQKCAGELNGVNLAAIDPWLVGRSNWKWRRRVRPNRSLSYCLEIAANNIAATPIKGRFANLADGSTFTAKGNTFQVNYSGGDGNDLTLTVVE